MTDIPTISLDIDPRHVHEITADTRGRVNLGKEYGHEDVVIAILSTGGDDE